MVSIIQCNTSYFPSLSFDSLRHVSHHERINISLSRRKVRGLRQLCNKKMWKLLKWNRYLLFLSRGRTDPNIKRHNHLLFYLCWLSLVTKLNMESIQLIGDFKWNCSCPTPESLPKPPQSACEKQTIELLLFTRSSIKLCYPFKFPC